MTYYGTCEVCRRPVQSPHTPAYPVTGYEVLRSQGGANAIRNRQRVPGKVLHETCVPRASDAPAEQGSLL